MEADIRTEGGFSFSSEYNNLLKDMKLAKAFIKITQ
jgi:hypothetical protein